MGVEYSPHEDNAYNFLFLIIEIVSGDNFVDGFWILLFIFMGNQNKQTKKCVVEIWTPSPWPCPCMTCIT